MYIRAQSFFGTFTSIMPTLSEIILCVVKCVMFALCCVICVVYWSNEWSPHVSQALVGGFKATDDHHVSASPL